MKLEFCVTVVPHNIISYKSKTQMKNVKIYFLNKYYKISITF